MISSEKQNQDNSLITHGIEQSATVLEALIFLPRDSWFAASCHKVLDDAFGSLHTAYSEQQGIHLVVWQSRHYAAPRFFDYQQSYIKHETSRRTDWQRPITYKARLVRYHQLLDVGKQQPGKVYLGIFKTPLHGVCERLYIVYRQQ